MDAVYRSRVRTAQRTDFYQASKALATASRRSIDAADMEMSCMSAEMPLLTLRGQEKSMRLLFVQTSVTLLSGIELYHSIGTLLPFCLPSLLRI